MMVMRVTVMMMMMVMMVMLIDYIYYKMTHSYVSFQLSDDALMIMHDDDS